MSQSNSFQSPPSSPQREKSMSSPRTPKTPKNEKKHISPQSDRFIPSRNYTNLEDGLDFAELAESEIDKFSSNKSRSISSLPDFVFNSLIRYELLGQFNNFHNNSDPNVSPPTPPVNRENIFKFSNSPSSSISPLQSHSESVLDESDEVLEETSTSPIKNLVGSSSRPKKNTRKISAHPFKILDAPNLQDDYYLNLIDWSSTNLLAVALGSNVFLWSIVSSKNCLLYKGEPTSLVTSVCWSKSGYHLAVGLDTGKIKVFDVTTCKLLRELKSHDGRVGSLAWNSSILASGSRDRDIYLQDIRLKVKGKNYSAMNSHNSLRNINSARNSLSIENNSIITGSSSPYHPHSLFFNSPHSSFATSTATSSTSSIYSQDNEAYYRYLGVRGGLGNGILGGSNEIFNVNGISSSYIESTSAESNGLISVLKAHTQEICGLKWSFDEKMLASGGNDNKVYVWEPLYNPRRYSGNNTFNTSYSSSPNSSSIHLHTGVSINRTSSLSSPNSSSYSFSNDNSSLSPLPQSVNNIISNLQTSNYHTEPICSFEDHTAAVKAVAWSPHSHELLASGGGTTDRHIRFWNTNTGTPLHKIDTGSQVCCLMWSKTVNEIVSTQGYSLNQVILWKYPTMQKIANLSGHTMRVLYLAMSPDEQTIVTGAGDETLLFWNIFPPPKNRSGLSLGSTVLRPSFTDIR